MPPPGSSQTLLSPAELSYLHTSLNLDPPIRTDLRTATQFRPLIAETGILPAPNGSARVCFSDGTEAICGVKAEVERTPRSVCHGKNFETSRTGGGDVDMDGASDADDKQEQAGAAAAAAQDADSSNWVEVSVEIPSHRDDDALPTFLGAMLTESLLSTSASTSTSTSGLPSSSSLSSSKNPPQSKSSKSSASSLHHRLRINDRWHWKLYIDLLMLSPSLSYPLPLLSLALHLALLDTRLPRRTSERDDDPMWDDDWEAARWLYPRSDGQGRNGRRHGVEGKDDASSDDDSDLSKPGSESQAESESSSSAEAPRRRKRRRREPNNQSTTNKRASSSLTSSTSSNPHLEQTGPTKPPITLLLITIGANIIFDPTASELAVADSVLAVSLIDSSALGDTTSSSTAASNTNTTTKDRKRKEDEEEEEEEERDDDNNDDAKPPRLKITSIRTIDPPSRLTPPGAPTASAPPSSTSAPTTVNGLPTSFTQSQSHSHSQPQPQLLGTMTPAQHAAQAAAEKWIQSERERGTVWSPPRGGVKRDVLRRVVGLCTERGGVGEEVLEGLREVSW